MPTENENNIMPINETERYKAWVKIDDTTWKQVSDIRVYVKITDSEWKGGEL